MKTSRVIFMGSVAVAAVIFFVWLTTSSLLKSEAAVSKVDIMVSVAQSLLPINSKQVSFVLSPQTKTDRISGVDLVVEVQNGTLNGWSNCSSLDTSSNFPFTELINKTGTRARYSCVVIKDKDQLPPTVTLAGNVSCTGSQPARVTVSRETVVSGPVEGTTYAMGTVGSTDVNCGDEGTGGGGGGRTGNEDLEASFQPEICTGEVGSKCSYKFEIVPQRGAKRISGVYVKLAYDGDVVKLKDVLDINPNVLGEATLLAQVNAGITPTATPVKTTPVATAAPAVPTTAPVVVNATPTPISNTIPTGAPTGAPTASPSGAITPTTAPTAVPTTAPTAGPTPTTSGTPPVMSGCSLINKQIGRDEAILLFGCQLPASQLPTMFTSRLNFDAIGDGSGNVSIQAIQVVGPDAVGPYTVFKGKASYRIGTGSAKGNIELDMKLRIQCVVKKPKRNVPVKVRVGLGDGGLPKTIYDTVDMKFDDKGFLVGKAHFNVPNISRPVKVLVKYEYGMQKKVGDAKPSEDYPGAYNSVKNNIILREGRNEMDFSRIILMTGDLPPDGQDGISNSKDLALVRNLIGKKDEESTHLADVNFDGVVNAVDHSCMLAFERFDQE